MAEKKTNKKKRKKTIAIVLGVLMAAAAVFMFINMFKLGIFPLRMVIPYIAGVLIFTVFFMFLQFTKFNIFGNVLTVVSAVLFLGLAIVINGIYAKIDNVGEKQKFTFSVLVLMEDDISDMARTYSYFYGYNKAADKKLTQDAIVEITKDVRLRPAFKEYNGLNSAIKALFNKDVKAVIFNEADRPVMESLYPDFNRKTRILKSYELENDIDAYPQPGKDSFSVYLSYNSSEDGFDLMNGEMGEERNIAVSVNLKDKKAVVIEFPKDCMIDFKTDAAGGNDKFAYLNVGDVNKIPATLKELLGTDINFFMQCHMPKENDGKGIYNILFSENIQYFTNIPPKFMSIMLREEIFNAKDWSVEYCDITGSSSKITGEIYGIDNMTVTIPDKDNLDNILQMLP